MRCVVWFIAIFSGVFQVSYSQQVDLRKLKRYGYCWTSSTNSTQTAVIGSTNHQLQNDRLLIYTSTLAVITIIIIFATLPISKSVKLLDYSSVLSIFGTLFLCLITNSLKDPGYRGCLCRMHTYVCSASCNGIPCYHMAGVYFGNQIID